MEIIRLIYFSSIAKYEFIKLENKWSLRMAIW
jgi:hypothetical protein